MLSGVRIKTEEQLRTTVHNYVSAIDPRAVVEWIYPLRDTLKLLNLGHKRLKLERYLDFSKQEAERTGIPPVYKRNCVVSLDAISVYSSNLAVVESSIEAEIANLGLDSSSRTALLETHSIKSPHTGVVFVGFATVQDAIRVAKGFSTHLHDVVPVEYSIHAEIRDQSNCWPQIFLSRFHPRQYVQMPFRRVRLAPWPSDILWRNLMATRRRSHCWPLGRVVQSVIIFLCCLILSSPSYLLVAMNRYNLLDWLGPKMSVFCYQWLPSLILVVASASVKKLVVVSESWNAHETYGNQEKAGQRNLFAFLVITVLMFPSLGVSGLPALFRWWNDSQEEVKRLRLECTFNPDSSALFINYVITRTAMYSAMTLFQTTRWIIFSLRCLRARSSAELSYFARKFTSPFPYRQRYAYMSLLLSIVIAYAPVAPIILLFGLLYFGCEYFVCKYVMVNLYYAPTTYDSLRNNDPSEAFPDRIYHVSWFIQCTRAGLTGICLACLNLVVFFGLRVKVAQNKTVSYILFTLLITSIIVCILLPWIPDYSCDWLYLLCSSRKDASVLQSQYPHSLAAQELLTPSDDEHPQCQHEYIAPFLRDLVNPSVT
ncbi:unnamed protein product [Dicrocoelium dendriticum]|nr:unnamed protein product [Dicrocoelium dendriticum]